MKSKFKLSVIIALAIVLTLSLCGCGTTYNDIFETVYNDIQLERDPLPDRIIVNDYDVSVGETVDLKAWLSEGVVTALGQTAPSIEFSVKSGDAVRIADGKATGLKSGKSTAAEARLTVGEKTYICEFSVNCTGSEYVGIYDDTAWFDDITVEPVAALADKSDFALGTDISMVQQVLDMGGKYYGADGTEQSVYAVMKDNGINTVRLRLWVDPYYYEYDDNGNVTLKSAYGGGICDLPTVAKMAADAYAAGLDIMVCAHYSDYWSTGAETIPKPWYQMLVDGEVTTAEQMAQVIKEYTYDAMTTIMDAGAKIKYWQLGNENASSGILLKAPGEITKGARGAGDAYLKGDNLSGDYAFARGTGNTFYAYLNAMIDGVKEADESTQTVLHALNSNSAARFRTVANAGVDFDIMGISSYIQYNHGTPESLLASKFNGMGTDSADDVLSGKGLMIVETSYAYTTDTHPYASNTFVEGNAVSAYPVSVQGQADNLRDTINAMANMPNGRGVITWEGAWLPVKGAGWSDIVTSNSSWSNQSFFSYDGKALPSLSVFKNVWPSAE